MCGKLLDRVETRMGDPGTLQTLDDRIRRQCREDRVDRGV